MTSAEEEWRQKMKAITDVCYLQFAQRSGLQFSLLVIREPFSVNYASNRRAQAATENSYNCLIIYSVFMYYA